MTDHGLVVDTATRTIQDRWGYVFRAAGSPRGWVTADLYGRIIWRNLQHETLLVESLTVLTVGLEAVGSDVAVITLPTDGQWEIELRSFPE